MTMIAEKFRPIGRIDLKAKIDNKAAFQLWNVLTKESYKPEANIPGSQWMPVDSFTEKLAAEKAKKVDTIVVYCGGKEDASSTQAAEKLSDMGYINVFAYEGGLKDWSEAGLPLVRL